MIPQIQEVNFPSYATLHQATVSLSEMGDRTISTQVRIDGDIVPDFEGWELVFKGERFILPIREPQATKDNTTRNSLVDLTFYSWATYQMKRYFFMSLSEVETGVAIPDQYNASVALPVQSFVALFNKVLLYYFGAKIRMDLYEYGAYSTNAVAVQIEYSYIWDVLLKFHELYGLRWAIEHEPVTDTYVIKVGYPADTIDDHDFEYGYQGGLLKFERQVQDDNIFNIILGRGGEKNLPYRYFKKTDTGNPEWAADPDAIPELANLYFDRLRDINFRWYVRGWVKNEHRSTSGDAGYTLPDYDDNDVPSDYLWAYRKGRYEDTKFNPVEYVKDDDSITKYGERWGALDDNDEIYPTIQGVERTGLGRVDEVVAVSEIITDNVEAAAEMAATGTNVDGTKTITHDFEARGQLLATLHCGEITIPQDQTGNLEWTWMLPQFQDGSIATLVVLDTSATNVYVRDSLGVTHSASGIPAGNYSVLVDIQVTNSDDIAANNVTCGLNSLVLTTSDVDSNAWKPTFDIWIKNIWETSKLQGETDEEYALRVWRPILGDRLGNEAKIVFSDGFMSISQDYEFTIASYPAYDTSKSITSGGQTYQSAWRITLYKSDAELDVTGYFIPNSQNGGQPHAGDHFFFVGIDMPHIYVEWAEERLNTYKDNYLTTVCDINPTWVITLDKVRVHTIEAEDYGRALADRFATGAIVNTRDIRFTRGATLSLYVQTLTYTWSEGDLVPNIEVVLSDKIISSTGVVAQIQGQIDEIRATYTKTSDIEAVVQRVSTPLYLKKTGEADTSLSPTQFTSSLSSRDFRQGGFGGRGWGLYRDNSSIYRNPNPTPAPVQRSSRALAKGAQTKALTLEAEAEAETATRAAAAEPTPSDAVLEIDKLVVRKEMHVNTLVVNQISYVGGKQITSAAAIECTQVVETPDSFICYFDQKQGTVKNLFQVNDIAMGQVFSAGNAELRYYKMLVTSTDDNSITLSKTYKVGSGVPKKGDAIVQYGNTTNPDRQYVIIRDVIGGGYDRMLSGLDSLAADGTEYYFAGRMNNSTPRWFVGDPDGDYAEFKNNKLKIKADIELEAGSDLAQTLINLGIAVGNAAKIFTTQPTPPYSTGDIWVGATYQSQYDNDILKVKANVNKAAGDSFSINDWELASGYTSNAALNTFITDTYGPFAQDISSQVDGKAETYYQSSDPSSSWNTTALKDDHIGDLWYNTNSDSNGYYHTYIYRKSGSTYGWQEINGVPTAVFNTIQGKSSIYVLRPSSYRENDLWIIEPGLSSSYMPPDCKEGDIVVATSSSVNYNRTHWVKKDHYVDQSAIDDFDYLTVALGEDIGTTQVSGGLVLATLIGVKNSNDKVVAGLNSSNLGSDSTNGRIMIFAGSSEAAAIGAALCRIYENGALYAEKAYIRGEIYAEKGTFRGDLVIGEASGRHMELMSGAYGTIEMFDSAGNLTTHIGNDYCNNIATFIASTSGNSPTIPSSAISLSFSGSGDDVILHKDKYYTQRSFSVTGDPSANTLAGNLTVNISGSTSSNLYLTMTLTAHRQSNGSDAGVILATWSTSSWGSQTINVRAIVPAGTYYLFLSTDGTVYGTSGSKSCNISISGGTFSVSPINQRLQIFANGLGYRFSDTQYAALLRETTSYAGSGDLAFQMRTGSSSNIIGMDIRSTGLKLYGPVRTLLGGTSTFNSSSTYNLTSGMSFANYSFIEIVARFNSSGQEVVTMLMTRASWDEATTTSRQIVLSTDSRYVITYKSSNTQYRVPNQSGCYYLGFYGIL